MMQHAAAIDVVELPEPEAGQVEQRSRQERDGAEPAHLGALFRHRARGLGEIEIDDLRRAARIAQMLRQHDQAIAGAAARHQRAERLREIARAGIEIVVELQQMAGRAFDQALRLLARVARRIGQELILLANLVGHERAVPEKAGA